MSFGGGRGMSGIVRGAVAGLKRRLDRVNREADGNDERPSVPPIGCAAPPDSYCGRARVRVGWCPRESTGVESPVDPTGAAHVRIDLSTHRIPTATPTHPFGKRMTETWRRGAVALSAS